MHKLILKKVGPIDQCELAIDNFTVLTGPQAAGKSTIAKSVAFFRTIKDDVCDAIIKKATNIQTKTLYKIVLQQIRNKFLQIFGSSRAMDDNMEMVYYYDDNTYVKIHLELKMGSDYISPNYIVIDFSQNIMNFLNCSPDFISKEQTTMELNNLFHDEYETVFIPAGRSLITLLTTQLNYIFTSMDEEQKRTIDFCTQKYIERILKIRPSFSNGAENYISGKRAGNKQITECVKLSKQVIKGEYRFINGEERLYLPNKHFVKINYTSSGQQETVWLINILLYQLANNSKTFVIIEEPEAHLYPNAQKVITDIILAFISNTNSALITTHSPYVLGTINNAIYASSINKSQNGKYEEIDQIINHLRWINGCGAYFVDNGAMNCCLEDESPLIKNEVIDGASSDINGDYDALFSLETR